MGVPRAGLAGALIVLALAGAPAATTPPAAGAIAGLVTTRESAPRPLRLTVDPAVCGSTLPDESIVVDAAGRLSGVVAVVTGVAAAAPAEAAVSNDTCRFVPRVSLLRPGGTVRMSSRDPVLHTMHAAPAEGRALFNVSLPIPGIVVSRAIDRPGVVTLSCSTHTWMRGYLFVTTELAAVSGADGQFRLDGVPPGTHEVRFWHETLRVDPVRVTVRDGETARIEVAAVAR